MTMYVETVRDGLVAVRVTGFDRNNNQVTAVVTSPRHQTYKRGETITTNALHLVYKSRVTKYRTYIRTVPTADYA